MHSLQLETFHYNIEVAINSAESDITSQSSRPKGDPIARKKSAQEYSDIFQGISCFEGKYQVEIDPKVTISYTPHEESSFKL